MTGSTSVLVSNEKINIYSGTLLLIFLLPLLLALKLAVSILTTML